MIHFALFAVAVLAPEAGPTEAAKPASETAAPAPREEKKICKTVSDTGTRLGDRRVCMTAKQWRKAED